MRSSVSSAMPARSWTSVRAMVLVPYRRSSRTTRMSRKIRRILTWETADWRVGQPSGTAGRSNPPGLLARSAGLPLTRTPLWVAGGQ